MRRYQRICWSEAHRFNAERCELSQMLSISFTKTLSSASSRPAGACNHGVQD